MAWWCAGRQSQHSLIVLPTDSGFGARLLELCNQGLFECLALNLHCLGGQQMELAAVINGRIVSTTPPRSPSLCFLRFPFSLASCSFIFLLQTAMLYPLIPFESWLRVLCLSLLSAPQRRMSRGVNPSLVSWLTTMMGLRLQVVLEHMPVGPDAILRYVRRIGDPPQVKAWGGAVGSGDCRELERFKRAFCVLLCPISQPLSEEPMEVQGSERTSPEPQVPERG